ncbi:DUF5615 family PIN-like protein [Roseibium aggregatum]|uniref:DUF5615 family PIN-like protein n=1 Tax=Roseibium aggregatum TaxID=187304 RepID=A0A926NW07_9HYPH|nr:DUF5615 family PIN-like protein [Roseibium aggregatum]MBD1544700.1 DUF5615 family PIN-like protein [Roseibium aggregatum]
MTGSKTTLRVLLDAGVPASVGRAFIDAGHFVIYHNDVLAEKTPDDVVCAAALSNNAILVAVDGDMKQFAKQYGGQSARGKRFANLSIIRLRCNEVLASKRISQAMSLIEHEWDFSILKKARRMWVDIAAHSILTNR